MLLCIKQLNYLGRWCEKYVNTNNNRLLSYAKCVSLLKSVSHNQICALTGRICFRRDWRDRARTMGCGAHNSRKRQNQLSICRIIAVMSFFQMVCETISFEADTRCSGSRLHAEATLWLIFEKMKSPCLRINWCLSSCAILWKCRNAELDRYIRTTGLPRNN